MADLSRFVHPRAVEFFERFMGRQAEAAIAVIGAPASTWSGRYSSRVQEVRMDLGGTSLATVTWDGDIEYDAKAVIEPIWMMCRRAGQQLDEYQWMPAKRAFHIVFHENVHAANQLGRTHRDSERSFQDPANRALEEGLTELFARRYLDAYLRELGVGEVAPGVLTARHYPDASYPHFVPAVELLVERLGERTGLGEDEILRRLVSIDCETRWDVVGDLLFDAEGLAGLVPEEDHAAVKRRLLADLRRPFSHLAELDGSIEEIIVASTASGYEALGWFDVDVEALRLEHQPDRRPEQLYDSLVQRQEQAALAVSGAHHVTTTDRPVTDLLLDDGSTVGEAWRQLCEHAGEANQPQDVLARYKEAFHVALEYNIRQSAGRNREVGMDEERLQVPGATVFSAGLARALSDDRLNAYLDQLGLDELAPGIRRTPSPRQPDRAGVAARAFVESIGAEIRVPVKGEQTTVEMDREVLLQQLAGQDPALPFGAIAYRLLDKDAFGVLAFEESRDARAMIQESLSAGFAQVALPPEPGAGPLVTAMRLGQDTAREVSDTVAQLARALQPPAPVTPPPSVTMDSPAAAGQVPTDARRAVDLLTNGRPGPPNLGRPSDPGPQTRPYGAGPPRSAPARET